jgi:ABC-type polar amino acid transport system ATPase subunit
MRDLVIPKNRRIRGFTTTQDSKTTIVRTLISDLEASIIELPTKELEPEVYKELSLYTYKLSNNGKLSFTHQNGLHDDIVDALMLANKARNEIRSNKMYISPARNTVQPKFGVM